MNTVSKVKVSVEKDIPVPLTILSFLHLFKENKAKMETVNKKKNELLKVIILDTNVGKSILLHERKMQSIPSNEH